MIDRKDYISKLIPFIDKPIIKVLTGMRRVGKSCLLRQIMDYLKSNCSENILFIDKESLDFEFINNYRNLYDWVKENKKAGKTYLFIDEVQEIEAWEKAITSLHKSEEYDIFITGSNAHLLSSELATYISGRYIEFQIYPLSYREHLSFLQKKSASQITFQQYYQFGGLPGIHHMDNYDKATYQLLESIYDTILLKDIVKRYEIRNIDLLEKTANFLFDNIGSIVSVKNIADFLKSQRLKIGAETLHNYIRYFCDTFMIYRVPRYDIKGKQYLETHEKYFVNDLGMRHAKLGYKKDDIAKILENLVFLELQRLGYHVSIGKLKNAEIDFVATKQEEKVYIQVAYLLASEETVTREFGALLSIKDNYPKFVFSLDDHFPKDYEGIKVINIIDFLSGKLDPIFNPQQL